MCHGFTPFMFFHIVVTFFQAYNCVGKGGVLDAKIN
nr:MAG TPA: hypothetical protein [Caudoviricetes sp.]